jgi:hypothetical protein
MLFIKVYQLLLDSFKVLIKVVHILDNEEAPVWELHYDVGTTMEMVCRVKRPPLQGKTECYLLFAGQL